MKNKAVLIKEIAEESVTTSGILLLNNSYNRKARVIATDSKMVKVNDIILKTIGNGTCFNIENEEYEIIHEDHILATLE